MERAGAPRESGADRGQQQPLAGTEAAVLAQQPQRQWDRRGGRVAGIADVVGDLVGGQVEALTDRAEDPGVGLVIDEQVDIGQTAARRARSP